MVSHIQATIQLKLQLENTVNFRIEKLSKTSENVTHKVQLQ